MPQHLEQLVRRGYLDVGAGDELGVHHVGLHEEGLAELGLRHREALRHRRQVPDRLNGSLGGGASKRRAWRRGDSGHGVSSRLRKGMCGKGSSSEPSLRAVVARLIPP